ncbi:MAG: SpoIIE family protein phosphatase [Prolixibacteraceae bacterium]|nr:SpoIIE family protein phosphatase [Prolixibacteraceae bacterium]
MRLVLYVLSFCVFLFIVSLAFFYFFSKQSIEKMTVNNAEAITQNTVLQTEQVLIATEKILTNYKWLFESKQLNCDSLQAITKLIVKSNPEIMGSAIAFEPNFFPDKGRYFCPYTYRDKDSIVSMYLGNANYEYFVMDWYQVPATINKAYWTEPYFDEGGSNALITSYSIPFHKTINGEKKFVGVITIDLSLSWLTDIVSKVSVLESGYAAVISRNGTFVTHPNNELIMNHTIFSYAAELNSVELREIGRKMQKGETDFASVNLKNTNWIISYTPLTLSNWSLAVLFPKAEMYAPLRSITTTLILLVVIGLILLTIVVYRIVTEQVAPLRLFANSAHEVANGNFNNELPEITTEDEMKDLHDSFVHMQGDLKNYIENLKNTTSAKEKIESELRIAREIQMGMIPKIFPPFPNVTEIDLYAMLEPAKEVGGDLYDFFLIDDEHLCFAIGDVSGKGVPASLFMAVTRTLLRSVAPNELSPSVIVNSLNKSLAFGNESSMFVTFFLGIIELKTGRIKYTNAGHNPPVHVHAGGEVKFLPITKDIPIGLFEEFSYQEKEMKLKPHDKMLLYTDGITEAENKNEELYSDQRLINCISIYLRKPPKELIQHIAMDVAEHVQDNQQSDDLTMLSIIFNGGKKEKNNA